MIAPRENPELFGHEAAEAAFREAADRGRLHHAWLLTGPEGVGKATLAYRFARALLAGFPEPGLRVAPAHPVFRRVAAGTHADLLVLARPWDEKKKQPKAEIPVDDVRALAGFLALTAAEGGWRCVVVDGADHLNRNAANALLKLLEEPPSRTVLLLTAAAPGRLLPTVRSRCRRLRLEPLAPDMFDAVLRHAAGEADGLPQSDLLRRLAGGAPGRALGWAEAGLLPMLETVPALLEGRADARAIAAVIDAGAGREAGLAGLIAALRQELHLALRRDILGATPERPADLPSALAACDKWSALGTLERDTLRFNLDKREALDEGLGLLHRPIER